MDKRAIFESGIRLRREVESRFGRPEKRIPGQKATFSRFSANSSTRPKDRAFTLLEIMLAVAVLGLVTISIYRFVDTTLSGVRISTELEQENGLDDAFERFFRAQIAGLPFREGGITGEAHQFGGIAHDQMVWYALPGFGALTRHAKGEQLITLTVQQAKENGPLEIGVFRTDSESREAARWMPILSGVKGFEVRYYQASSQQWFDKWTDRLNRPNLIRLRYWRGDQPDPVEIVASVPHVSSEALAAQLIQQAGSLPSGSPARPPQPDQRPPGAEGERQRPPRRERNERSGAPRPRGEIPTSSDTRPAPF